ncbi:MAG: hypothetical protein IE927_13530 [Rhodobacterales bacterium]|nr:hypothetical protein [Rhodobacterales bacterium]
MRLVRVHECAGRLRLRTATHHTTEAMARLADRLARVAGVVHVAARPNTGSVILTIDRDPAAVLAAIEADGVARILAPDKAPPVGQVLTLGLLQADMNIRKHSDQALDLRTALALLLIGGAILQAARGRIAGPATTLAMAAFSLLDTPRR